MIELIMSIGFCIDFSAHLVHAFLASAGRGDRTKRAYAACEKVGMPIFNSAMSSIFGVLILSFSNSYLFKSFFKTVFLIMSLGLLNSLLFLPVFLSLIGPHWKRHEMIAL
jgi:predicted RND superfamily exporter protein